MQAISVRQPYAWAIARGHRTLSNQEAGTGFRGTVLIHASMRVDLDSCALPQVRAAGWDPGDPLAALGAVIAVADVAEVCDATAGRKDARCDCGVWAKPGEYHWG
ncbi:ASCH domain-containing protein, partial [Actinocorallia lasiicapitis]